MHWLPKWPSEGSRQLKVRFSQNQDGIQQSSYILLLSFLIFFRDQPLTTHFNLTAAVAWTAWLGNTAMILRIHDAKTVLSDGMQQKVPQPRVSLASLRGARPEGAPPSVMHATTVITSRARKLGNLIRNTSRAGNSPTCPTL